HCHLSCPQHCSSLFILFHAPSPSSISTLSLHDALPIFLEDCMTLARIFLVAITAYAGTSTTYAQWPQVKTPGIPRLPNGKADLSAPAPRAVDGHPDLSGVWDVGN